METVYNELYCISADQHVGMYRDYGYFQYFDATDPLTVKSNNLKPELGRN